MRPASIWRPAATSGLSPAFPRSRRIRRTSFEARDYGAGVLVPRAPIRADGHAATPRESWRRPPSLAAGPSALPTLAEALSRETPEEEESGLLDARGAEHAPLHRHSFSEAFYLKAEALVRVTRLKRPTARARCFT